MKMRAEKLVATVNEFKGLVMSQMDLASFENTSVKELELMKKTLEIVNGINEYMLEEAYILDRIDGKLDKLLTKKKEGSC